MGLNPGPPVEIRAVPGRRRRTVGGCREVTPSSEAFGHDGRHDLRAKADGYQETGSAAADLALTYRLVPRGRGRPSPQPMTSPTCHHDPRTGRTSRCRRSSSAQHLDQHDVARPPGGGRRTTPRRQGSHRGFHPRPGGRPCRSTAINPHSVPGLPRKARAPRPTRAHRTQVDHRGTRR